MDLEEMLWGKSLIFNHCWYQQQRFTTVVKLVYLNSNLWKILQITIVPSLVAMKNDYHEKFILGTV